VHKDEVILRFRDNGLGINLDRYKDRLFGMYQRFHVHPDSRGLGLYIIHSQIQSLGGRIEVESVENEGTTFIIYLKPPLSYEGAAN
jgi:signal transduction histidine kinase